MRIGLAGLGKMGGAIAARLIEVGHEVTVWNRSPEKAKPLQEAGAKVAATPAALASDVEVVMTILTDAKAIDQVYDGPDGLLSGDVKGKLIIDMSTVQRVTEVALADRVRAKGAAFVECPVGGTVGPARQGTLLGIMGAEPADAQRARPILEKLCRRVEHVGPVGNGATVKLAVNLPLMISWQAYGEAFALVRDVGFEPKQLLSLFTDTSGTTNALKARAEPLVAMLGGDFSLPVTFAISDAVKDLHTMLAEGKARGVELPLIERTLTCFDEANRKGWDKRDGSAVAAYWEQRGKASS